jgi:diaminohydroxyphosphoribosylaminopyrimidine deaminase / 5-amino-6-(5-phosphoribosylamino)uracil reductase
MLETNDSTYLKRCIELAGLGLGHAAPNPLVGSVIVYKGLIVGEGYHQKCGQAHAEVMAIRSVKDQSVLQESTLYVNLEPCAHYGKTPPCCNLIIEKKIPRVVVGCIDPYSKVAGKGIAMLQHAGCNVTLGVLEPESKELNKRFFTFHLNKRPYIILKWAKTHDGFIDIERKPGFEIGSYWITNEISKMLVHKWRTEECAFMVGANTVLNDNPRLTVREWSGRNPVRIIVDKDLSLPSDKYVFNNEAKTIVFNQKKQGCEKHLAFIKIQFDHKLPLTIMQQLYEHQVQSVIIEGGSKTLQMYINAGLWDEARVFTGARFFGKGIKAPEFNAIPNEQLILGDTCLEFYRNPMCIDL